MKGLADRMGGYTYALMRIIAGGLFLWHGVQKLTGFPIPLAPMPPHIQYGAGAVELVGGTLIMIGLFTRPAAFLCSGLCAFAYWSAHGLTAPLPIQNGGEMAVLYCFVFLFIACRGVGMWGIDKKG